jgi:hypothetical protein
VEGAGRKVLSGTLAAFGLGRHEENGGATPGTSSESASGGGSRPSSIRGSIRGKDVERMQKEKEKESAARTKRSLEALLHYLSDRRQKVLGALRSVPPETLASFSPDSLTTNSSNPSSELTSSSPLPPLSSLPISDLLSIPSIPIASLSPEQIYRVAQVVDTALFKAYLVVRPSLVGSLCRLENFCEVEEIEGVLRDKKVRSSRFFLERFRDRSLVQIWDGRRRILGAKADRSSLWLARRIFIEIL